MPRAYSSDGGFTITGMMLTMAVGALVAVAVGLLAGVIGQFFYVVLIFPVAIGSAIAGAQVAIIGRSKVRNPLVCGFAGLIAGVIAVATMHYVQPNTITYANGNRCKKSVGRHVFDDSMARQLRAFFFDVEQSGDGVVDRLQSQVDALAREAALCGESTASDTADQQPLQT